MTKLYLNTIFSTYDKMTSTKYHLLIAIISIFLTICSVHCRVRLEGRIINGNEVDIEIFPFVASLQSNNTHVCGATIVSERILVTAAHCDVFPKNSYKVRVGSSNYTEGGILANVSCIKKHPKYNPETADRDVAVILLTTKLNFEGSDGTIGAVTLPPKDYSPPVGLAVLILGWGATDPDDLTSISESLQIASLWVTSREECKQRLTSGTLTENMFCAQNYDLRQDACTGDSGGPLIGNGQLLGIVSWGMACADGETPGVYASVPKVMDFIISFL